jgi:hypothetical protein
MHVGLIIDDERLERERPMLNRLAIGLIGEGVRVTRIVPEADERSIRAREEQRIALATRVETPMRVLPWMRKKRVAALLETLEKAMPDVFVAIGEDAWQVGLDLTAAAERPLVINVWSAGQLGRLPRGRRFPQVAGYLASSGAIRDAIVTQTDPDLVTHVPMGVAFPASPKEVMVDQGRAVAIAAIGGARDVPAYRAMLSGLARIVRNDSGLQVFLELAGPNSHEIWRHAQRLEMLSQLSAVGDASKHRDLIAQCDLVLLPEQYGEPRSIVYECMAHGVAIVAAKDPLVDGLEHGVSAVVLDEPSADAWAREINRLLTDLDAAKQLSESAREYARRNHRSSDQVERLVQTLHRVAHSGNIPIEGE